MSLLLALAGFAIGLSAATVARADVTFSLASSSDLSQLALGDTATVRVDVSGAAAGQPLDSLTAIVTWDAGRFGLPSVAAGALLPPHPDDFLVYEGLEVADVAFLTFGVAPTDHIIATSAPFAFFSFDVIATAAGGGSFQLGSVSATEFNPAEPTSPLLLDAAAGPPLPFAIAVPEPASLTLLAIGVGVLAFSLRRKRR